MSENKNLALTDVELDSLDSRKEFLDAALSIDWKSQPKNITDPQTVEIIQHMAKRGENAEADMTLKKAIKVFKKGIYYSCLLAFSCVMEGYDCVIVTGFFATPSFKTHYGCITKDGKTSGEDCEVPVGWQIGLITNMFVGEAIGLIMCGFLTDRFGFKKTMIIGLSMMTLAIFGLFFAREYSTLTLAFFTCGLPWGIFQTLPVNYASDICPTSLRGYVTSFVGICWIIGQLCGSTVQYAALLNYTTELQFKIPIALQWIWPVPLLFLMYWVPESPKWCVRNGDLLEAHRSLTRLSSTDESYSVDDSLAQIWRTDEDEKRRNEGKIGYMECTKGVARRRTLICCIIWGIQQASGAVLLSFSPYFLSQAGIESSRAFQLAIIQYAVSFCATLVSWKFSHHFGRRAVYLWGLYGIMFSEIAIGSFAIVYKLNALPVLATSWCIAAFLLLLSVSFGLSINPITFTIVAEIPSPRLKAKTINVARGFYILISIVMNALTPFLLNPTSGGIGALSAWFFFGIALGSTIYAYICLPECSGLTVATIDELFVQGVKARDFARLGHEIQDRNADEVREVENRVVAGRIKTAQYDPKSAPAAHLD